MNTPSAPPPAGAPVEFRLAPVVVGIMWAGAAFGLVLTVVPRLLGGEGAGAAAIFGLLFAAVFGVCAALGMRYQVTYDPAAGTVTTATVGRRVADLTAPFTLEVAGDATTHGYRLRTSDAGKVGLSTALQSAEGYDVHDLCAEIAARAPQVTIDDDLRSRLDDHARTAAPLAERTRSTAVTSAVRIVGVVAGLIVGRAVLQALFGS